MRIYLESTFSDCYRKFPLIYVDVGASGGLAHLWKPAKKHLRIIGFEPDNREFSSLEKGANNHSKYLNTGLYCEKKSLDFYLTKKQQVSSIFKPNRDFLDKFPESDRFDIVGHKRIEADTLDDVTKFHGIVDVDFIKIDTQGSELFVLQGARETIKNHAFGLEIEVEFVEMYKNQPLFGEVDGWIRKQGFHLFDIQNCYWKRTTGRGCRNKRGQIIFGNALYLRNSEDFKSLVGKIQDSLARKSKVLKAITICSLYGYFDYAVEILEMNSNVFDENEYQKIKKRINNTILSKIKIPDFRGKRIIGDLFYFLWELWRPTCRGWSTVDRKLGNR